MIVDKKTLCDIFGVSQRALSEWTKDSMPIAKVGGRGKSNEYDTVKVVAWYKDRQVNKAVDEGEFDTESTLGKELMVAKIRSTQAIADINEHKLSKARQEVVSADAVRTAWSVITSDFKQAVLQLSMRLGPKLLNIQTQREVQELIQKETKAMLVGISQVPTYELAADELEEQDAP